jgi:ankyrin repeat protein
LILHSTTLAGDLAGARDLILSGADVNARETDGFTPLMIASGLGQPQMVELLLNAGADVLILEPRMGATALHKAAQSGNREVIKLLLHNGAFVDQQSPVLGNTALMDAILHKQEDGVRTLLSYGAKTSVRNHWDQTALDLAESEGLDAITQLIRHGIRANEAKIQRSDLVLAAKAGDAAEVKRLIAIGVDVNQRTPITGTPDDDYTPLGIAAREGHAEIVGILKDAGADTRQVVGLMKGTPFHEAAYYGHASVIEILAETDCIGAAQPELDAQGPYNGLTALHDAAWHGHMDAVRSLINARARLDLKSHAGLTPRELALLYGYDEIASLLAESESFENT